MTRSAHLLAGWFAALAACAGPMPQAGLPPLDATWVCSMYVVRPGALDSAHSAIGALAATGALQVIGSGTVVMGGNHGIQDTAPLLLLAGKPELLATAHARLAPTIRTPNDQPLLVNGCGLVMARRPGRDGSDPEATADEHFLMSLFLLPTGTCDRIQEFLQPFWECPTVNLLFPKFRLGNGQDREMLIVEGPWEALDGVLRLVREKVDRPVGFFYCRAWHLP